jgi:protein TonB
MLHATRAPHDYASGWLARQLTAIDDRWPGGRRRAGGLALALLIEAGLFLAILTLGQGVTGNRHAGEALTTVDFAPDKPPAATPPAPEKAARPTALPRAVPSPRRDQPAPKTPPFPMPPPAAVLPVAKIEAPAADSSRIRAVVRDDMQGPAGPPDTGSPGDSQRVGTRPNGDPIYAARWYREPTEGELRGYLSTASGPGWALITCRTAPGFRVEDCELVDEYPAGAQIGRAVMAAAWQFKVRPPQMGGRVLVGEWVRIRITYDLRRG